jgi:hypothetical protein
MRPQHRHDREPHRTAVEAVLAAVAAAAAASSEQQRTGEAAGQCRLVRVVVPDVIPFNDFIVDEAVAEICILARVAYDRHSQPERQLESQSKPSL